MTYRHLMLEHTETGQPPVLIGPVFAHQKKESETYASGMLELNASLKNLLCFGTDGEAAIAKGFQIVFPDSKHILCFLHQRRNIQYKLTDIGISSKYAKLYLNDIFGYQESTHYNIFLD